jgi:hypothetical protein
MFYNVFSWAMGYLFVFLLLLLLLLLLFLLFLLFFLQYWGLNSGHPLYLLG